MFTATMKITTAICFSIMAFAAVSPAQVCQPAHVGLTSWWAADGSTLDSRSRINGTLIGNANFAAGQVGQAFNLDGDNDSVEIPTDNNQNINGSFSAEAWVFPRSFPNLGPRILDKDANTGSRWLMALSNSAGSASTLVIAVNASSLTAPENSIVLNQWSHVAFTYNTITGGLTLYINGVQSISTAINGGESVNISAPLRIGDDFTSTREFDGLIDEPAIYQRLLSATEIAAIHVAGTAGKCKPTATVAPSGLAAWYGGDGDANDISGNNLNGTMQLGADFAIGKVGQAFRLVGGTQYVDLGPGFNLSNLTLEAWVFIDPATNTGGRRIISKDNLFLGGTRQLFVLDSSCPGSVPDGRPCFSVLIGGGADTVVAPSALTAGWHHLAGARDTGANRFELYVDGVLAASTTPTVVGAIDANVNTVIGRVSPVAGLEGFQGLVDEAAIYNRALTQDEITSIVNAGIAGKLKDNTTPTGSNVVVNAKSDATVTFPTVTTSGTTQQIPLLTSVLPILPMGTHTGLAYDLATSSVFTGSPAICFNLPTFTSTQFTSLRIMHIENGSWVNRTAVANTFPTLCSEGLTSLSPFAIVVLAPTAANVSVGGRVLTADGSGISKVRVSLSDSNGNVRTALTNPFGSYKFDEVEVGATYLVSVRAKQHQFENPTRTVNVVDELTDVDFTAQPAGVSVIKASGPSSFPWRSRVWRRSSRAPTY